MKKILLILFCVLASNLVIGQAFNNELVSSSGDTYTNSSYQLDWSIGECVTETQAADNYIITQGFHQGKYFITELEDLQELIKMQIYPNPTSDVLNLEIEKSGIDNFQYKIYDFSGQELKSADIKSNTEQINFETYSTGTYLISIFENNQKIKTFKIIKK